MKILALGVSLVLVAAVPSASLSSPARDAQTFRVTLYFLTDGGTAPLGVRTSVRRPGTTPLARVALAKLLRGPAAAGAPRLATAIPPGATIRSFTIRRRANGSVATIDLVGLPSLEGIGAPVIARVGTQVARTVIGLSDVRQVRLRANGRPWAFWSMGGGVLDRPWDYSLLLGLQGICTARPGTEAVPGDCFTALP